MKYSIPILILIFLTCGCTANKDLIEKLQSENATLQNALTKTQAEVQNQISTFLTFQDNNAEEAMNFYVELFDNSEITEVNRYGKEGPAQEGTLMFARFILNGKRFMCSDSPIKHEWNFTPGVSNFVDCESEAVLKNLFEKLSENGKVYMPLNNYGFSKQFGFVEDRFGVSWQLNLD